VEASGAKRLRHEYVGERDDIERKLSAASTWLIIDKPFLGALVLRMPLIPAKPGWCRTTATDARAIYYSPDYIGSLDLEQTKFALAHEALHCALLHFHRRGHRDKHRWDIACDHAINPLLAADGLKPPPDALLVPGFEGMTAEEIYPLIQDNTEEQPQDDHAYDGEPRPDRGGDHAGQPGGGAPEADTGERGGDDDEPGGSRPAPLSASEREALAIQWQQRLAGAAQQALQAGKLRGSLARLVDHLLQPQLPWRMLLARYMTSVARDDYSFQRPSRREGAAILPSLKSAQVHLVVILDTSGSISDAEIQEFASELNAIKGQVGARIVLHTCDERLADDGPWTFEPWEEMRLPGAFRGGGGTRFTPAFEWIATMDRKPDLLVYFTDAEGEFPEREPTYPVLWLVKGRTKVPWGQRIQLN
jgi:predicted metal-dependent peptidase